MLPNGIMTADTRQALAILLDRRPASDPTMPQLPVPWWSFTKTILAAAALCLVARGDANLDQPMSGERYTLRQLLRHTSGVRNYTQLAGYEDAVRAGQTPWPADEMLSRLAAELPPFEPHKLWAYSNTGYCLVRRLIEDVTGLSLQAALEQLIFDAIGVRGVSVAETPFDLELCAWGNPTRYHPGWVYHGLLMGSPLAAAQTLFAVLNGTLLPESLLAQMRDPVPIAREIAGRPGRDLGYGMGLMMAGSGPAGRCYGHTGHDTTSVAAVYHYPDLTPPRTVAAFLPGDRETEVEWLAAHTAMAADPVYVRDSL